jgi:hypothetical protein
LAEQAGDHLEVLASGHGRFDRGELTGQPDRRTGGLAGAVGAEYGEDRPLFGEQVQPVQSSGLPEPLDDSGCLDHRCHPVAPSKLPGSGASMR